MILCEDSMNGDSDRCRVQLALSLFQWTIASLRLTFGVFYRDFREEVIGQRGFK